MLTCHDPVTRHRPLAGLPIAFAVLLALAACTTFNSGNHCVALSADWYCSDAGERDAVTKDALGGGGVLCCKNGR